MKASAFVVGPPDGPGAAVMDMAKGLGFASVANYSGIGAADSQARVTPLVFFLFSAVADVTSLRDVASAIRYATSRRIRFSPMVYFAETASVDTIKRCIDMGFDDVVTLPFTRNRLETRIERMVDRTQVYCETARYFGPDHRGVMDHDEDAGQYRRLEIVRSSDRGVSVVRDEICVAV
jgi:hypothetical protein